MSKTNVTSKRLTWEKNYLHLPKLDLLAVQLESYKWFLERGIAEILAEVSPIDDFTGKNYNLAFGKHILLKPSLTPRLAMEKGLTFDMPLKVEATLLNKQTGETIKQDVFLGDIPKMTERGTFIVNGIERVVVNQLVRSPGVFFTATLDQISGKSLYTAELRPMRGSWLEFSISRNNVVTVRIDRRKKFFATTFLRAIGITSDDDIRGVFSFLGREIVDEFIENTIRKDPTKSTSEALLEIYRKMRPGEPAVLDNAQEFLRNMFFNNRRYDLGEVGRYKINKKLGLSAENIHENFVLTREDIIGAIGYLINLTFGKGEIDDIDHLANRRVRCVGELVASTAFRVGLLRLERMVKEKMTLLGSQETLVPAQLINARPIIAAINEFFRTSQLSTILDQTNPLSEIDNLRRLTVMGTGGISRERASFSIRDINASQYSRIDPVRSPEGPNIGLVTYMTLFTQVNKYGFLEAPYLKVQKVKKDKETLVRVTDEIVYLAADDEQSHYITHSAVSVDKNGYIIDKRAPVRYKGEFLEADTEMVEYIDVVPRQVVGTAASLIPFLAHDEANRALMGTHMQCQAVPLIAPDSPIVGTGMESEVAKVMGRVQYAEFDGKITYSDAASVTVKGDSSTDGEKTYAVEKFKRSAQSTCYSQSPKVVVGQKVHKGDVLIDGPASKDGELALGQNLTIAYASFDGLGYEDAIVISDRLVKEDVLTSIHIEKYDSSVVDTKIGPEETTRDIPNVSEEDLSNLDDGGIVVIGSEVAPNDILVGKIAPKGETELTAEERLLRAIFGEKAREVRDTSLRMPHGERGTVVDVQILDREKGDELEPGTNRKIIVKVAQLRHVVVGDKLAGRHGNKGVISKIIPSYDMPYLEDGTPVDIIISPLSVLARMNLGQLLEGHLGWAAQRLNFKIAVPVFEKFNEDKLLELMTKANLPLSGKVTLFDGRTGEPYEQAVVVGKAYIMKLIHMIEDKTHARSTGPYSLVTQQPLGGKAQMGGQRLGEMEVWALEAYRAAYTLQEMLTIKSDDVVGRAKAFEAIVKGVDIPTPKVPESFKVLVKELQGLGLNVTPTGAIAVKEEETEVAEAPQATLAAAENAPAPTPVEVEKV